MGDHYAAEVFKAGKGALKGGKPASANPNRSALRFVS
jgi:hypothetical protein